MIGTWRWRNSSVSFLGRGGDDGGYRGMSFYVLSRGLEDMMVVCVGGVDLERQKWEVQFLYINIHLGETELGGV